MSQKDPALSDTKVDEIRQLLHGMVSNTAYNTEPTYSANLANYPDHLIPFVEKHLAYLKNHPKLNPEQYLANLRLMTKIR